MFGRFFATFAIAFMASVLIVSTATAQSKGEPKKLPATLAPVKDIPGLPRVLLLGDSISIGYTLQVRKLFDGKANIHRPPLNCHASRQTLEELDSYLGDKPWDVIHFNCGIHDLTYRKDGKAIAPPDGTITVPLDEYKKNLQSIVAKLKKTNAKLIWATTTPFTVEYDKKGYRRDADVRTYNDAALEIMKGANVRINDLYKLTHPEVEKISKDGVHFTPAGYDILAKAVADTVKVELKAIEK